MDIGKYTMNQDESLKLDKLQKLRKEYKENPCEETLDSIVDLAIGTCPKPEHLGLYISQLRVDEFRAVKSDAYYKVEKNLAPLLLFCGFVIMFYLVVLIFNNSNNSFAYDHLLAPILFVLSGAIIYLLFYCIYKIAEEPYAKRIFNKLNNKECIPKPRTWWMSVTQFSQDELSQIEKFLSLQDDYNKVRFKTKKIIKEQLKL